MHKYKVIQINSINKRGYYSLFFSFFLSLSLDLTTDVIFTDVIMTSLFFECVTDDVIDAVYFYNSPSSAIYSIVTAPKHPVLTTISCHCHKRYRIQSSIEATSYIINKFISFHVHGRIIIFPHPGLDAEKRCSGWILTPVSC